MACRPEAVERGVEGALLDLENILGDLLDALGDGPAVLGLESQGFEDQEIEGALNKIVGFAHRKIIYNMDCR